jgi:hypothetical protein
MKEQVIVSLLEHQIVLGRCLQASKVGAAIAEARREFAIDRDKLAELRGLVRGAGFRFTRQIQRSWCIGRTTIAAKLTLSLLTIEQHRRIVGDWVDAGGGKALDLTSEAAAFLDFVAQRLTDPSHALSVCRMEQAAYRASAVAASFGLPDPALLDDERIMLRVGRNSALVRFFAEPRGLFDAIAARKPLPPLGEKCFPYLFAPGLPTLRRSASKAEARVWDRLASPASMKSLRQDGYSRQLILQLFSVGAIERD